METSTSETPEQRLSPSRAAEQHEEVVLQSFLRLGLQDEEHGACESSTDIIIEKKHRFPEAAQGSSQWMLSGNSVSDNVSIWGYPFFFYGGDSSVPNTRAYKHDYFKDIAYDLTDLRSIQETLRGEQSPQKERLIFQLLSSVFTLMTDKHMHSIFQALLDACEGHRLDSLVGMILSEPHSFLNAAFCKQGVHSIVKLIRKLKKSPHAFRVTAILSTGFVELMTNSTAREVVQRCFILFRREANEVLYERAITHCHYLATHQVGCGAINDCISTISGEQRSRLLYSIAGIADIICDDFYGNYVLQNVMDLQHGNVNENILDCLRGKFIQLSLRRVGSHTVEKCLMISEACMLPVIKEMLQSPRALRVLAEDEYGNYVLQKALEVTNPSKKHRGFIDLHNSLVNSLQPHSSAIVRSNYGRNVINAIIESKKKRDFLALNGKGKEE